MPLHPQDRCLAPGQLVETFYGKVPIEQVREGELVLTHAGRWRQVLKTKARYYAGKLIRITCGKQILLCTPDHRIMTRRGWIEAQDLREDDIIVTASEIETGGKEVGVPTRRTAHP